jgi:putative acetyltransferase
MRGICRLSPVEFDISGAGVSCEASWGLVRRQSLFSEGDCHLVAYDPGQKGDCPLFTMHIRPEQPADFAGIRQVNLSAFETATEADLVDALRDQVRPLVSLVAEDDGAIVGHILFSPMTLPSRPDLRIMGLAPMAVVPARQRQGIGSALAKAGITACRDLGCGALVVLGHAEYYPRFGFVPASRFGLRSEYDVPDDVFMAMELTPGALRGLGPATIRYHAAFGSA